MLFGGNGRKDDLVLDGMRVVDPTQGIDEVLTIAVERGVITRLEPAASAANGRVAVPAFVDPHVHLRTPGREDEEDIATGTRAGAAGGYCAILGMPNTDPVVDSAAILGALIERAEVEAEIPVGFLAAISKRQEGGQLTEMVELAERGAAGFSDDGRPVESAGLLDLALAAYEEQPLHLLHLSARESVDEVRRARAAGVGATGEVTPHHLCITDEAIRTLDPNLKMNPPLRA